MKLSNSMKEAILKKALASTHDKLVEIAEQKLATKCVEYLLANGEKKASEIPAGFERYVCTTNTVYVPKGTYGNRPIHCAVQLCDTRHGNICVPSSASLWEETKSLYKAESARDEFRRDVKAVLAACTTDKHLIDTLPELAIFLPEPAQVVGALVSLDTLKRVKESFTK